MNSFHRQCLLSIFTFVGLLSANSVNTVNAEQRPITAPMASTFRIKSEQSRGNSIISGHGTAFGIDLSEYGYHRPRYALTACHVIREHDGSLAPNLKLELKQHGVVRWVPCHVLASDSKMDVALVECESDLPLCATFAEHDALERTPLVMIGSPAGVPLRAVKGYVITHKKIEPSVAYVDYIQEGCSGGPVFDASSQTVVGLVIAGIGKNQSAKMDPHTCLYVSLSNMNRFLCASLKSQGDSTVEKRNAPRKNPHNAAPNTFAPHLHDEFEFEPRRNTDRPRCRKCEPDSTTVDRSGMWLP